MVIKPSVQDFLNVATSFGFSRKYNFQIESIEGLPQQIPFDPRFLLYVQSARLPSRKISTTAVPFRAFEYNVPTVATYPDNTNWPVTFISDNQNFIRSIFEAWNTVLYNEQNQTAQNINFGGCKIVFNLLGDQSNLHKNYKKYILWGAFPTLLEGVEYNITDTGNQVITFNATFAYQYFTVETVTKDSDQ